MRIYNRKKAAAGVGGTLTSVDPCPVCGVRQAEHWKCQRCTSRGHLLGHSLPTSPYCDDCRKELAAQATKEAA